MDDDKPFQRPPNQSDGDPDDEQAGFLDDLTSLFDEDDDSNLPQWAEADEESTSVEQESTEAGWESLSNAGTEAGWESLSDVSPQWRDDDDLSLDDDTVFEESTEVDHLAESASVFEDPDPTEAVELPTVDRVDEVLSLDVDEYATVPGIPEPAEEPSAVPRSPLGRPRRSGQSGDTLTAIVVGLLLGGIVLGAVALGEEVTLVVLAVALLLAATEWFTSLRRAGYQPPSLVGMVGVVAMPLSAYWRGADGMILVLVFALFAAGIWYLGGVSHDRPLANLGLTMLGITYIGVAGGFGGLLLDMPDGAELVLSAVILTVAHDIGAYAVGRAAGRTPLSAASPNKTVEGLIGGTIATIAVALVVISILEFGPFGSGAGPRSDGVVLGIVVAVVAPLADLMESSIKRDLGVKDMGSILPAHGGMLDRIDALLFVLPATYYTALILDVI